jgi:hypothetical protein
MMFSQDINIKTENNILQMPLIYFNMRKINNYKIKNFKDEHKGKQLVALLYHDV